MILLNEIRSCIGGVYAYITILTFLMAALGTQQNFMPTECCGYCVYVSENYNNTMFTTMFACYILKSL